MKCVRIVTVVSFCLLSMLIGFFVRPFFSGVTDPQRGEIHEINNEYSLINPLLQCEQGQLLQQSLSNFKSVISRHVDQKIAEGSVKAVSVYYRDLNDGPWFGINETEKFLPASLLKVPTLISFLSEVEKNPSLAQETIVFEGSELVYDVYFSPRESIVAGETYTLQNLAERMIIYSDNDAALLLAQRIGNGNVSEVYKDLALRVRTDNVDFMSAKDYATFFRLLYNASYLSKPFSQAALSLLTQVDFSDGLVAGVPSDMVVSHKFGERVLDTDNLKQFHDCGIVYYPHNPYMLCVMTRGEQMDSLVRVVAEISKLVYTEVEKQ